MRVGLLTYALDRPLSGLSRYTLELARALALVSNGPEVVLLTAGVGGALAAQNHFRRAPLPGCRRWPALWTLGNLWIPMLARNERLDVIHDPSGATPFCFGADGARTITTIHDVFAWSCPGNSTLLDTLLYRHWLPRVVPRVDAVITVSQASKADIVRYLKVVPSKVRVVYRWVHAALRPSHTDEIARAKAQYRLPDAYILFLGSVEKRKNVQGLLHAYAQLRQMGEALPLVVVGVRRWNSAGLARTLRELDLEQHVLFSGYVPDADLPALYSGADLFVFPSLYEGFGLPPLEAMACGTPVVCSNAASLPEVVGDAAITVDPCDVEGLAEAMHRVLTDVELQEQLREKGLEQARQFTWERTARETVAVYREVCG
jgi:glycosyltransferase involved in cell wall biosynthesis